MLENCPGNAFITKEHEYYVPNVDNPLRGRVGITDFAAHELGDLVYLQLPDPEALLVQFRKMGEVESVKSVSELFSPVNGRVLAVNSAVLESPWLVTEAPYGEGWMLEVEIDGRDQLEALMTPTSYREYLDRAEH